MDQSKLCISLISVLFLISRAEARIYNKNSKNSEWNFQDNTSMCLDVLDSNKVDCHPDRPITQISCVRRGCCHKMLSETNMINQPSDNFSNAPFCFFPPNYMGYEILKTEETDCGLNAILKRVKFSGFPSDIQIIKLDVIGINENTIRVKIMDNSTEGRFEVPLLRHLYPRKKSSEEKLYQIELSVNGTLLIIRKSSGIPIFNLNLSQLIYSDQFLQTTIKLSTSVIYGLGEHYDHLRKNMNWTRLTIFNKDAYPRPSMNLYGSHPFYIAVENDSSSHGVALFNSNAMDVILQPAPLITFRTIGGILDFLVYMGPTPSDVVVQHVDVVGHSFLPPYWSLGFHLCRFGMKSLNETINVLQRNLDAGIPLDVQWNDMDYMKRNNDFTYDTIKFKDLPEFVDDLHSQGLRYVIMVDPGVSGSEASGTYSPYDDGINYDIFIKTKDDKIFKGKVWNLNSTVFPDFSHPHIARYWNKQFFDFYQNVSFDGAWIDMNEISNFLNGTKDGCPNDSLESPPYVPGDGTPLSTNTLCMNAKHYSSSHYNEHNLHSYREGAATYRALQVVTDKRPFIISRATFLGQGKFTGHWSGDIASTWEDMRYSIVNMLAFNMFGVSMTGSDICGFRLNTTVELCARWSALGAFYPFARNHNERTSMDQDPAFMGSRVVKAAKKNLYIRYTLLPYLYTLFYRSYVYGETVARPLFFEFTNDSNTFDIEEQFMWGPALMIMPVLYPNAIHVKGYIPKGVWYELSGYRRISTGDYFIFPTNDKTVLSVRGGYVLPMQHPSKTTKQSRSNQFMLLAALDEKGEAFGELYWDDGESIGSFENRHYNLIHFYVRKNVFTSIPVRTCYASEMPLDTLKICSLNRGLTNVTINLKKVTFKFDQHGCLFIHAEGISLLQFIKVVWN